MREYFDALTSAYFKTGQDGSMLFCPWGAWGACYILPSEQGYQRLRRQVRNFAVANLVVIIATAAFHYLVTVLLTALLIAFYIVWVRFVVRGLRRSAERLSMQESITAEALSHSAASLWLMGIISVLLVALGIGTLIYDPANWPLTIACIAISGFCAAGDAYMLVIRSRRADQRHPHQPPYCVRAD